MKTNLSTVPNFLFHQEGEESWEEPVHVKYYNHTIEFNQGNQVINLNPETIKALFKETLGHMPEATKMLNKQ